MGHMSGNAQKAKRLIVGSLREPFLHFLLLGAAIYGIASAFPSNAERYRIRLGKREESDLARTYLRQFGNAPTEAQLHELVDHRIREEIFFREGVDLGLDREDEIVRRRVAQKFEFLQQDRTIVREPDESELRAWFVAHRELYSEPERVSFTHIYFSPDKGGPEAASKRAAETLASLADGPADRAPERGDAFPDQYDYAVLSLAEVKRIFGEFPVAEALFRVPAGTWAGPFRSGFGEHLVRVIGRVPGQVTVFSDIREKVRADWLEDRSRAENAIAFGKIKAQYSVVRQ
jgi:peptidyl-prolyl cis-trans isomerase C